MLFKTFGSDYFPIDIIVSVSRNIYRKKSFNMKAKKTNWEGFNSELENGHPRLLSREYSEASVYAKYVIFINLVSNALINNAPRKRIFKKPDTP